MGLKELFESAEVLKFIYIDFPISIKRDLEPWQIKQNYIPEFSFENKEYDVYYLRNNSGTTKYLFDFGIVKNPITDFLPVFSYEIKDNVFYFTFKDIKGNITLKFMEKAFFRQTRIDEILNN